MFQFTSEAIQYSWGQLFDRIGAIISGCEDRAVTFENIKLGYYASDNGCDCDIIVIPCSNKAWNLLLEKPPETLSWVSATDAMPKGAMAPSIEKLPVLFWGEGYENGRNPIVEKCEDGKVIFYVDIIASTFFMLTRWEETVISDRDQHARFPATSSVAFKQGFLGFPVIDEYALILKMWLKLLIPGWKPREKEFSVKITHDIDSIRGATLRSLAGDIIKRRDALKAIKTAKQILFPENDPFLKGCYKLAELSEEYNFRSTFYFMSASHNNYNSGYDPMTKLVQLCIDDLRKRDHEVGFHAGYYTFNNMECFLKEKAYMDAALGKTRYGGRQHFLRFSAPETWRIWEAADLCYDSTLSYADHEGFRCGTCHPFHPFDIEKNRQMNILEIPLIVMDGTLRQYRNLSIIESEKQILLLAQRCKMVNGVFTILWHNSSLNNDWELWASMYQNVLSELSRIS